MTLEDILTLSKAGYTAQQITALNQQSFQQPQMAQPQVQNYPQMVQPQMPQPQVQNYPQMVQPQMPQPQVQNYPQMLQPQMVQPQMVQPQMAQPQIAQPQMVQPQMAQPQMAQPQMVQNYPQFGSNGQYNPVLPQNNTTPAQIDPMKDVMLEQYMNVSNMNMYDVKGVVADMIGANPPMSPANNAGGVK